MNSRSHLLREIRRLRRASEDVSDGERERRREDIRRQAEHANFCGWGEGGEPLFEIDEAGDVFCTYDGKPVTDSRQILAEAFYQMEVAWGCPLGHIHDEETETFYNREGQAVLSREHVDLRGLFRSLV